MDAFCERTVVAVHSVKRVRTFVRLNISSLGGWRDWSLVIGACSAAGWIAPLHVKGWGLYAKDKEITLPHGHCLAYAANKRPSPNTPSMWLPAPHRFSIYLFSFNKNRATIQQRIYAAAIEKGTNARASRGWCLLLLLLLCRARFEIAPQNALAHFNEGTFYVIDSTCVCICSVYSA